VVDLAETGTGRHLLRMHYGNCDELNENVETRRADTPQAVGCTCRTVSCCARSTCVTRSSTCTR